MNTIGGLRRRAYVGATALFWGDQMTQQILGPSGSPRRRWTVFVPLLVAFALGLMYVAGAQAVHDEGVFELEGNATAGRRRHANNPANPQSQLPGGDDWAAVFSETDSADATAFESDFTILAPPTLAGAGDSILSQDTKDIQRDQRLDVEADDRRPRCRTRPTSSTLWAQYTVDKSDDGTPPPETCGSAPATEECEILYFGADRFSNSGDTVMGFWFFRSDVTANAPVRRERHVHRQPHRTRRRPDQSQPPFSRGDILVVSDFRQGGKAPNIQIYEWVTSGGSASTHLDQVGGGDSPASCTQAPGEHKNDPPVPPVGDNDNFCATANQFVVTSPWPYLAKDNSGGTSGPAVRTRSSASPRSWRAAST